MEKYILNSSPFISLAKSGLENILLAFDILIPSAVKEEIQSDKHLDEANIVLAKFSNRVITDYSVTEELSNWGLGKGETSVIASAISRRDYIAVLDDGKARKCAKLYDLTITGTIGLLLIAKEKGIISDLKASILKLKDSGLYLSDELIRSIE